MMELGLIEIALILNSVLVVYLGWRLRAMRRFSQVLQDEMDLLRLQPHDEEPDLERLLGKGERPLLVLDILNPMEVAAEQSWFADKIGGLAPPLIRKIVFDQACKQMQEDVAKYGIRSKVWVHRGV